MSAGGENSASVKWRIAFWFLVFLQNLYYVLKSGQG